MMCPVQVAEKEVTVGELGALCMPSFAWVGGGSGPWISVLSQRVFTIQRSGVVRIQFDEASGVAWI